MKKYNTVLGGTFDRLHIGHIFLLKKAFESSKRVTIGLTKEHLLDKKVLCKIIQPYGLRKKQLSEFQKRYFPLVPLFIIPLKDIYGTAASDSSFTRLILTSHSYHNGEKINNLRIKLKKSALELKRVPLKRDIHREVISSSRIRMGEINADGTLNQELFSKELFLPQKLRSYFSLPLGRLISNTKDIIQYLNTRSISLVVTVGDVISTSLIKEGYIPDIAIIDFKTKRAIIKHENIKFDLRNNAGTINSLFSNIFLKAVKNSINNGLKQKIIIEGEEDLLVLPAILLSPLRSVILYGQPDKGVVLLEVNEALKLEMKNIILQFNS